MLTALDFLTGGAFEFNFLVRFRGFEDGGSDKVGAIVVPLPPAFALAAFGLLFVGAAGLLRRVRQRRKHAPDHRISQ